MKEKKKAFLKRVHINIMHPLSFMKKALQKAQEAYMKDEVPVGAVLVHQNQIISAHHNKMKTHLSSMSHAEMLCIQEGITLLKTPYLNECDLYVSLEPCAMCASTLKHIRIRNLYFGAYDPKGGGVVHGSCILDAHTSHTEYYGGYFEQESSILLNSFFKMKRL